MRFKVKLSKEAKKDLSKLDKIFQEDLKDDIELIESKGLDFVISEPLGHKIFEIKSGRVRALYGFMEDKIIVIAVIYLKKSQKCPQNLILRARQILDK